MHKISAGTIFSPRELESYRRWQRLFTALKPAEQGYFPSANEYEDFQQWLQRQDSGYFSDVFEDIADHITPPGTTPTTSGFETPVALICKHAMHPVAASHVSPRCPVCTIDVHVNYMKVLTQALKSAGGRAPSCTLTASEHQDNVYSAWIYGKVCTLRELSVLESMAEDEDKWLAQHPEANLEYLQTATKALGTYWYEAVGYQQEKPLTNKNKCVVFSQGALSEPGRPAEYFWKKSLRYEPGKYAIIEQHDEGDDGVSEDSEDYSQGTVTHFGAATEPESEGRSADTAEQLRFDDPVEELDEDDDDSDWEDIDSDGESSTFGDEADKGDYICFEVEEESNFIVFADD